jgi:hypothetical protein
MKAKITLSCRYVLWCYANMRSTGTWILPVSITYATISMDEVTLYCDDRKVKDPVVQEHEGCHGETPRWRSG